MVIYGYSKGDRIGMVNHGIRHEKKRSSGRSPKLFETENEPRFQGGVESEIYQAFYGLPLEISGYFPHACLSTHV